MAEIFSGLASMLRSETIKPSSMPLGTPKTHFSGLSLMPFARVLQRSVQDWLRGGQLFGFDHDVVNVGHNGPPDEVSETLEHTTLVCSPSVLQTERHCDVAEQSEWGDQRCHELVVLHRDLMVPRVRIKEAKGFAP